MFDIIFDIIFELVFATVGVIIGKTIIPIITFGKFRFLNSKIENSVYKRQKKWYGIKVSDIYYLSVELTGAFGIIFILIIIALIAYII